MAPAYSVSKINQQQPASATTYTGWRAICARMGWTLNQFRHRVQHVGYPAIKTPTGHGKWQWTINEALIRTWQQSLVELEQERQAATAGHKRRRTREANQALAKMGLLQK